MTLAPTRARPRARSRADLPALRRALPLAVALAALAPPPAAAQDLANGAKKAEERCADCHGPAGRSTEPTIPSLAGQTARYLYLQLKDFKEGRRTEPAMEPFLQDLQKKDLQDLAAYFAAQRPARPDFKPDPARVARGKAKAAEVLCTMCHLGGFKGQNEIPRAAGLHHDYLVKQMEDFKHGRRTNDAGNMTSVSRTLSDEDIEDLAHYLSGLE